MSVISSFDVIESLEVSHEVGELVVVDTVRGEKMGELEELEDEADEEDEADGEEVRFLGEEFVLLSEGETGVESGLIGADWMLSSDWGVWLVMVLVCVVLMMEVFVWFS